MRFPVLLLIVLLVVLGFLVLPGDLSATEMPREMAQDSPDPITKNPQRELFGSPEPPFPEKGIPEAGSFRTTDFYIWLFGEEGEEREGNESEDKGGNGKSPSFFGEAGSLRSFDLIGWLFGNGDNEVKSEENSDDESRENTVAALSDDGNIQAPPPPVPAPDYETLFTPLRSPLTAEGSGEGFDLYLWFLTELPARRINTQLRKLTEKQQR